MHLRLVLSAPRPLGASSSRRLVLSALIGARARIVCASPAGPACFAAEAVAEEVVEHPPALARRCRLDAGLLLAALSIMSVEWQPPAVYEPEREEAERRMAKRDPEDWLTVALALVRSLPIWSQDNHLEVAGVTLYTTGQRLDAIRNAVANPRNG